ncbi:MAG: DUF3747 domain-containing protein [Hormoscilla sp. GUM202]|nr:DUF3747 domain-containing protein [Hormoscilla sp. GUM202]
MKISSYPIAALTAATLSAVTVIAPSVAATFGQREVAQENLIAVAAPRGTIGYQLFVLEQKSNQRACWSETPQTDGTTLVELLLLNFDFTGICSRAVDSNGFSIRAAGQDMALKYSLRVVERNGDLVLLGVPDDRNAPELEIGRTNGVKKDFVKIELNPGWRFSKRTYNGQELGHIYFTNNLDPQAIANGEVDLGIPSFGDIANDIYFDEINAAVDLGFISGFAEDNTFRPQVALTREQLVSMIWESLTELPGANINIPTQASKSPYPDVETSRWSAAKIQWAKDNNIISGYTDGTFRPAQPVTRAELIAVQRRSAEFAKGISGLPRQLTAKRPATNFSDTSNHWAEGAISQMSSYCSVASPLNEIGSRFVPDEYARRNYAAASTLRMLNCVKSETF